MKIQHLLLTCLTITFLSLTSISGIAATNPVPTSSIFDEISYIENIDITLEVDMDALTKDIRNTAKHKAKLSFIDRYGEKQVWDTKVNLRGKFRRMNCTEMPPLKINFKKSDLRAAGLLDFDDMKMVTHCIQNKALAKELILKEFLAYKLYNQITDESFRVQLLNITYLDSKSGKKKTQAAFLIEDTAQLRARLKAKKCKNNIGLSPDQFKVDQVNQVALFQYMVGNADWSLGVAQNVKMIRKDDKVLAIPYDFDFSGLVDAPYAIANSNVGQTKVKERIFLGLAKDQKSLEAEIKIFNKKKRAILSYIRSFKLLKSRSRKEASRYVKSFYKRINEIHFQKYSQVTVVPAK